MASLPPGTIILLGALILPLLNGKARRWWMLGLPVASLLHLIWFLPSGHVVSLEMFGQQLRPIRIDKLSLVWGYVFHVAAILGVIYAWHVRNRAEHVSALLYAAASIGAVFAGDLLTLFVYWELTAIASVFLIWSGASKTSFATGMRYAVMHIGSGVLLLSGALLIFRDTGSLRFGQVDQWGMFAELTSWGQILLLLGFGIKAAFPLLHCWLPDAYPESTPSGTVFLSAFTTKMAIYALARGFAGCDQLINVGAVMVIFPLIFAMLADDMRRTLAHVLNNQLGFMVVAIGVGTPLAIGGAAAQAFAHVIYKGLLFMSIGAVLYRTGTAKQSQLGGLFRAMPWTCGFCLVGALSVLPLNCGFVTKALVLSAVAEKHLDTIWLILVFGAAGAFLTAGIKVPYFTFFAVPEVTSDTTADSANKSQRSVEEAPRHMLIAMGISAALCLLIGIVPSLLYQILPHDLHDYHVYDFAHVTTQLQLLLFTTLGFVLALRFGFYPRPILGTMLDVDWIYRKPIPALIRGLRTQTDKINLQRARLCYGSVLSQVSRSCSEAGILGRTVSTNAMGISAMVLLAIYLLAYFR